MRGTSPGSPDPRKARLEGGAGPHAERPRGSRAVPKAPLVVGALGKRPCTIYSNPFREITRFLRLCIRNRAPSGIDNSVCALFQEST